MSGLSVATCMEISVRLEQRPQIFEVHTVNEEGGEEALGAGEGSGRVRQWSKRRRRYVELLKVLGDCRRNRRGGRMRRKNGSVVLG